ncbi:Uma2 family endonuclease [Rivularia sp. UHCC 0363]|uniref:Uma2 family endonuclease n=1 Tax=Rivularia sp. UHCC 0363 TaxID=3110244 RepID=UPI002B21E023|nr:Uma2 family endonuclease [Rivularia sp. UHCC 0363]MEA5592791.1 Uma2 family endonuclease [Rivularia sp. UHCC 0363]
MVTISEIINNADIEQLLPEKRVSLNNISWQAYEQILNALGENRAAKVHYYQSVLEIMTPLEAHESSSENIGILIHILTEELNLNIKSLASTTLKIPDKKTGAEPDKCYYIKNEPAVRGKTVNLNQDPPPDLVLEVDIIHTDINKKQLYQDIKVPEFWRYNGKSLTIYILDRNEYQESEKSFNFPILTKALVSEFISQCRTNGETQAKREFRIKIRELLQQ